MGNDPVNRTDPNGGFDREWRANLYAFFNGGDVGYAKDRGEWFVGEQVSSSSAATYRRTFESPGQDFMFGMANAWSSNNGFGERWDPQRSGVYYGQLAGDGLTGVQVAFEYVTSATMITGGTVGGIITSPTGIGAVVGGAVAYGGYAVGVHATLVGSNAISNILKAEKPNFDDDEYGGTEKMGKPGKNRPGNNKDQNEQTNSLSKKYGLDKDAQRKLHDRISGGDYSYRDIEDIILGEFPQYITK
jgi:hypothetical protein